jgi:hypothetical protein
VAKILSEGMNPIITRRDPWTTRSEHAEDVMAEFGQIFDYNLTVSLYIYGSLACLAVASAAALWVTRSRDNRSALLSYRHA